MDTMEIWNNEREMDTGDIRDNGREMDTGDNGREMDTGDIRDKGREMDTGDIRDNGREMDTGDNGREMDTGDIRDKGREMDTGDIRDNGREMDTGDIRDKGREMDTGDIRDKGRELDTGDIRDKGREMETGDISDSHKEMACEKAAVEHQWEVVIQLLCDGVSPAEWIISELFENMTPQLLSCFSPGKLHSSVRRPLMQFAVRFGKGDFLLQILHHERVPDRQLMDTIMFAVHLRQGDVLLQLFRCHSRSCRVFRLFFPSEPQSDDEEIRWIFNCLYEGGEKDLALYIGTRAKTSQRFFRTAVRWLIRDDDDELFVHFCIEYFCGADLEGNHRLKGAWQFASLEALKAKKYKCIGDITSTCCLYNSFIMMRIVLNIVFGSSDLDTVSILQDVCCLHSDSDRKTDKVFALVLDQLFRSKQWQKHVAAVNEWLSDGHLCYLPCGLLPAFISRCETEKRARVIMSRKAKWCQRKSYYNLAFVLAFSVKDWNMLEEMLTRQHYCPPFDLRCIDKLVYLGRFSIAVAFLRLCIVDSFPSLSPIISEESIRKLADKCLDVGLMTWAVHFTIPDWNRIHSLVQTGHHPDALNYALRKAVDHDKWDFFENLVARCTDPDGVMKEALIGCFLWRGKWNYVEKLMDRCTDPATLNMLLTKAVYCGRLEVVRSVIWRVSVKDLGISRSSSSILSRILQRIAFTDSSNLLQVLCVFVKAGVSTVDRSAVSYQLDCPLHHILYRPSLQSVQAKFVPHVTRLVIQSGAVSYRILDNLRHDSDLQQKMQIENDESWKQCYTDIVEAAATPCRLQHLARLTVSDAIGCHPGRPARIDSLPIAERLKDLINFKDITEQYEGDVTNSMKRM